MDTPIIEPNNLKTAPAVSSKEKSSFGSLITLVVIVAVIVIGAFYVWGERVAQEEAAPVQETQ